MLTGYHDEKHANYQPYYGWGTPTSNEYHTHVSSPEVSVIPVALVSPGYSQYSNPGFVSPGFSQYPNHGLVSPGYSQYPNHGLVSPGYSQYPNHGHVTFNDKVSYEDETRLPMHSQHRKHHHAPQAHKGRVHFAEHDEITKVVDHGNGRVEVHQESVDADADGFIKLRHKNFELANWETFKR